MRAILDDRKRKTRRLRGLKRLNSGPYKDCVDRVDCRDGVWHFWQGEGSVGRCCCLRPNAHTACLGIYCM